MSKRFGRNQRRKAREALAAAEEKIAQYQKDLQWQREVDIANEETVQMMTRLFGDEFVGNPFPKEIHLQHDSEYLRIPKCTMPSDPWKTYHELCMLDVMQAKAFKDDMRDAVYVRVKCGDREGWAMSMDAKMFRNIPEDYLITKISRDIARGIVKDIRNMKLGGQKW